MTQKKQILLNAFNMNCVGHINHGLWTHPRDQSHRYNTIGYWTDLARTLERGLFDGLFIADIVGYYDVYQQGIDLTLKEAIQLPVNDPWMLASAMAAATRHLGFGLTVSTSAEHPYTFARRVTTLDHLSGGRLGWNIVTGYLESGAAALGRDGLEAHDQRYERADDFLALCYKLWETGWDDDAVVNDKPRRVYTEPSRVHRIEHDGPFFRSSAYHMSEPSIQRTPVLFQAGTSARGARFAGEHAECVFIGAGNPEIAREKAARLRKAAADAGRDPRAIKIFVGITVVPGRTESEAREKLADYRQYASAEAGLAHFAASTGIDFSRYGLDDPIDFGAGNAIQSANENAVKRGWTTRRQLLQQYPLGGMYPLVVGSGAQVADELIRWIDEGDIDGFNVARTVTPETYEDFVDLVVPELQNRGRFRTAYTEGSLRHKLYGAGDRLPDTHPAGRARREASLARQALPA